MIQRSSPPGKAVRSTFGSILIASVATVRAAIFDDCTTYSEFTDAASALIPTDGRSSEPFWALAARTLFIEMCMKLIERGETSNKALADPLTAPKAARMADSMVAASPRSQASIQFSLTALTSRTDHSGQKIRDYRSL